MRFAAILGAISLAMTGCGKKSAASLGASNSRLFQSADAPTKALWEAAVAAVQTNGFAPAILTLKNLQAQTNLTPEQVQAVNQTVTAVSDQMYEAANKGDQDAAKAIQELRNSIRR